MASCERQSCDNYMLLKPKEASIYDLACFLLSSTSETGTFVECKKEHKGDFWRRWYIFSSLLLQKLLLFWGKPMDRLGNLLEMWLNLLSRNDGFFMLLFHLLKRTVQWPDRSSESFTSVMGYLDTRVELDERIKHGDPKFNTSLAVMASKLVYENKAFVKTIIIDRWRMKYLSFDNFWNDYLKEHSTRAIMFQDTTDQHNLIVVAFRGTHPFDPEAMRTDVDLSWVELKGVGKFHRGFMYALGMQEGKGWPKEIEQGSEQQQYAYYTIIERLRDLLKKNENAKFILTGHSLGGALAILFVTVLAMHKEAWLLEKLEGVYTFGQPRVGDKQLGKYMKEKLRKYDVRYLRYVYCNDVVPRIPYDNETLYFSHFAPCLYYNSCYRGKVLPEEPNKNYFSLLWAIPQCLNAVWELIRSFTIPYIKGPEYGESWLMKMVRVLGLVIPGLAAHCPQNYVTATRLGSPALDPHKSAPKLATATM